MKLSLLRHGEPVGGRIYRGNQDDPLTEKGWQQMLDASRNQSWDLIVTSPLLRCQSFAQYLHQQQQSPLEIVDNFSELGFGDWQSQSSTQIGQDLVDAFKLNPIENKPPNAEDLYDFQYRVLNAFKIITSKNSKSVLIIAHAGVIRVIKSYLLNLPIEKMFKIDVLSASCEEFEI